MRHRNIEKKYMVREHFLALAVTGLELLNVMVHWS